MSMSETKSIIKVTGIAVALLDRHSLERSFPFFSFRMQVHLYGQSEIVERGGDSRSASYGAGVPASHGSCADLQSFCMEYVGLCVTMHYTLKIWSQNKMSKI
jgi:hypothetical protein